MNETGTVAVKSTIHHEVADGGSLLVRGMIVGGILMTDTVEMVTTVSHDVGVHHPTQLVQMTTTGGGESGIEIIVTVNTAVIVIVIVRVVITLISAMLRQKVVVVDAGGRIMTMMIATTTPTTVVAIGETLSIHTAGSGP